MDSLVISSDIAIVAFMLGWSAGGLVAQARRSTSILQAVTFSIGKSLAALIAIVYICGGVFLLGRVGATGWAAIGIAGGLIFAYIRHGPSSPGKPGGGN